MSLYLRFVEETLMRILWSLDAPLFCRSSSREDSNLFRCRRDGGAQPKPIDPFGYHMVRCKCHRHNEGYRRFSCIEVDSNVFEGAYESFRGGLNDVRAYNLPITML